MSSNCTTIHAVMLFLILSLLLAHNHDLFSTSSSKPTKNRPRDSCPCTCPTTGTTVEPTFTLLVAFLSGVLFTLICTLTLKFPSFLTRILRSALFVAVSFSRSCLCCIKRCCPPPPQAPANPHRLPTTIGGGISATHLDTLPTFAYSAEQRRRFGRGAGACAICLSEFLNEQTLRWLPDCDHLFHQDCIDTWLGSNKTCPCCRGKLESVGDEIEKAEILLLENGVNSGSFRGVSSGRDGGDGDLDAERRFGCEGGGIGSLLRLLVGRRRHHGRRLRHR